VNLSHLAAIIRLRWQIANNQFSRSGRVNRILTAAALLLGVIASLGAFGVALLGGRWLLSRLSPFDVIYVWDGLAGAFLFFWAIALMVELQRSEMLSLRNLLHLPISLSGAFLLNYASSLVSLTLFFFLPAMLGFAFASVLHFGASSLVVFALLASFLLMVTAVSYQLRGWLARLMENKRTRGTVIAVTTFLFVALFQIPNLVNMKFMTSRSSARQEMHKELTADLTELQQRLVAGEIDAEEYSAAAKLADEAYQEKRTAIQEAAAQRRDQAVAWTNALAPIGWLPYGASAAASGAAASAWLCVLGMSGIGALSLALAYRSTMRAYTGADAKVRRSETRNDVGQSAGATILEKDVPLLTESQSVIALMTLRSLMRAPEAKMALLTPLIFTFVFGSMILSGGFEGLPEFTHPWIAIGAIMMSLVGMAQIVLNMFGLDRHGFRAYVLMPTPRRDVLIGKNMGVLPLAAILSWPLILFAAIVAQMEFTHVVASLLQVLIALLIYFTISNFISITAPVGMAAGTMKPVSMNMSIVLWQFAAVLLIPVAVIPAAAGVAAEQLAQLFGGVEKLPIYLFVTLLEIPLAIWCYRAIVTLQGRLLQEREQAILAAVTKVAA
jgi:ABC-2 type transport system permease protein